MQRHQCWQWVVALSVVASWGVACGDGGGASVFGGGGEGGAAGSDGGAGPGDAGAGGTDAASCDDLECSPDATCEEESGEARCVCRPGFEGDGTACEDRDECEADEDACDPAAECTNTPGGFECTCPADTLDVHGDGSECSIGDCADGNGGCDPLTTCTPTDAGRTCGPCPAGYTGDGEAGCADVDECETENGGCDWLTTCTNTEGGRTCGDCPAGYTGDGDAGCVDVDECEDDNGGCPVGLECLNIPGGRACGVCPPGYTGNAATGCRDVDECVTNNGGCDALTSCRNTPGSRVCGACPAGYTGNGQSGCDDIDECSMNHGGCDALVTCTNTGGGRTCGTCPAGYAGTGTTACVDRDECLLGTDNCHADAACTNTPGGFSCACNPGHYGNGVACVAARSCTDIRTLVPNAATGAHVLDTGSGPFRAFCDMTTLGGAWTLAMKIDGRLRTFQYDAALWTNRTLLSPNSVSVARAQAKLEPFNSVAFTEVLLALEYPVAGTRRLLRVAHAAPSLFDVFSRNGYTPITPLGRNAWKGLVGPTASLQAFCNREGFNVSSLETPNLYTRVRLGILANQENDCLSADSYIGVGGLLSPCVPGTEPVAGGTAGCDPDNGVGHFPGFAYVYVR